MLQVFVKIAVIFSMIATGYICDKTRLIGPGADKWLVNILLLIASPCLIISSLGSRSLNAGTRGETLQVLIGSLIFFLLMIPVSRFFTLFMKKTDRGDLGVLMAAMTGMNSAFMGFPVTKAIFGDNIFFLMVIQNIMLNLDIYFILVLLMNAGPGRSRGLLPGLKSAFNVNTVAALISLILFFTGRHLPAPVLEFTGYMGDMTIPLSMIVVGLRLAGSDLRSLIRKADLIKTSAIKVLVIPALTFLAVNPLPLSTDCKITLIFAAAFPTAVILTTVAAREKQNSTLMAGCVALSTAMSMVTLPLIAAFLSWYYHMP